MQNKPWQEVGEDAEMEMREEEKGVQGVEREREMIKERRKKGMGEDTKTMKVKAGGDQG